MLARDYFLSVVDSIDCNGCGRCCPTKCGHLKTGNLCDIHPNQHEVSVQYAPCVLKPLELVLFFGIYCYPAIEVIQNKTRVNVSGGWFNSRFCNSGQLEKALSVEVT